MLLPQDISEFIVENYGMLELSFGLATFIIVLIILLNI